MWDPSTTGTQHANRRQRLKTGSTAQLWITPKMCDWSGQIARPTTRFVGLSSIPHIHISSLEGHIIMARVWMGRVVFSRWRVARQLPRGRECEWSPLSLCQTVGQGTGPAQAPTLMALGCRTPLGAQPAGRVRVLQAGVQIFQNVRAEIFEDTRNSRRYATALLFSAPHLTLHCACNVC